MSFGSYTRFIFRAFYSIDICSSSHKANPRFILKNRMGLNSAVGCLCCPPPSRLLPFQSPLQWTICCSHKHGWCPPHPSSTQTALSWPVVARCQAADTNHSCSNLISKSNLRLRPLAFMWDGPVCLMSVNYVEYTRVHILHFFVLQPDIIF